MLTARSLQEAELYLDLHPCECGARTGVQFSVEKQDGQLITVYEGECPGCGRGCRHEFLIPDEPVPGAAYGGPEPSSIADAGEFLWYSDRAAEQALRSADSTDQAERLRGRSAVGVAIAALDEVLKFLPPDQGALERDSIASEFGRAVFDANPDRFERERLAYRRELLQEAKARLARQ